jgi:amino acid transporter
MREVLLGGPKNFLDPRIFHNLTLVAFFAWVGLGSDGLSSSAYGPEEAFVALGGHHYLALPLAIATILTVFLISASYSFIVELFPTGGGGYLVATKLLGPALGLVTGSALVIDYVLTIAISVASGCDAIFSFLPPEWYPFKLVVAMVIVLGLTTLNARGVRESVGVLVPIFLTFLLTHVFLILYGVVAHADRFGPMTSQTAANTQGAVSTLGWFGVLAIFFRAYSLGGGTYTGIEAVSNSTEILREPRDVTAKKTMLYMAISLAFTAGGILICYLLYDVRHVPDRTLNAVLWSVLAGHWQWGEWPIGTWLVWLTLLSEAALLFVAAQTGFVAGPRTLAAMAVDLWVPKRFAHLSERLVTQNGVLTMGIGAALVMLYTRGSVDTLVVMYAACVFVAFTLTQGGMIRHWWAVRAQRPHWKRRIFIAGLGTAVTASMLTIIVAQRWDEGVVLAGAAIGAMILLSVVVRSHYRRVRRHLASLDEVLTNLPLPEERAMPDLAPDGPTAIVLVESYSGLGIHTLLSVIRLFPRHFKNIIFCSAGLVDSGRFKGQSEMQGLEDRVRTDLEKYVQLAQRLGYYSEYRFTLGTDLIAELEAMCVDLIKEFRRPVVFAGQLVFQRENVFTRSLHHETAFSVQRRLQFKGIQVIILPIRVWGPKAA